jgi:Ca2+-transporting ATPase
MITGDHPNTSLAIADQLGIANKHDPTAVLRGSEIEAYSDLSVMAGLHPFPTVFARVNPEHKLKIVQALKMRDEVCAMTGDGVNDAPAIRQADVGIAMGITGTDLTKDCADFILTDDNFTTIVEAIREGRHIYDNVKGFTVYLLSTNFAEVFVMLACAITGLPIAFTTIMILTVNTVINVPPSIALGIEKPRKGIMKRKPRNPKHGVLTTKATALLIFQALTMAAITFLIYALLLVFEEPEALAAATRTVASGSGSSSSAGSLDGLRRARAVAILTMSVMFLVQAFMSKSMQGTTFRRDIFANIWLDITVCISFIMLIGWIFVPGMRDVFGQLPPKGTDIPKIIGAVIVQIASTEAFKALMRWYTRRSNKRKGGENLFHDDF